MKECGYTDVAEFGKILRCIGYKIRLDDSIPKPQANKIVRIFTGHDINWYKHKQRKRDKPVHRQSTGLPYDDIEKWFANIMGTSPFPENDCLLGLVSEGGFLSDRKEKRLEFIFPLDPHLNILIGNRGSGKSTTLNLIGLLVDTLTEETKSLENVIINLVSQSTKNALDLGGRIRKSLRNYSVQKYALFYIIDNIPYCYYVEKQNLLFNILSKIDGHWVTSNETEAIPEILFLKQGEVLHIAEDGNKFFNGFLDNVYNDLQIIRQNFAERWTAFCRQYEYFSEEIIEFDSEYADRFLHMKENDLLKLSSISNFWDRLPKELKQIVNEFKFDIEHYKSMEQSDFFCKVIELLRYGNDRKEIKFLYLYLLTIDINNLLSKLDSLDQFNSISFFEGLLKIKIDKFKEILGYQLNELFLLSKSYGIDMSFVVRFISQRQNDLSILANINFNLKASEKNQNTEWHVNPFELFNQIVNMFKKDLDQYTKFHHSDMLHKIRELLHINEQGEIPFLYLYLDTIDTVELEEKLNLLEKHKHISISDESILNLIKELDKMLNPKLQELKSWPSLYALDSSLTNHFLSKRQKNLSLLANIRSRWKILSNDKHTIESISSLPKSEISSLFEMFEIEYPMSYFFIDKEYKMLSEELIKITLEIKKDLKQYESITITKIYQSEFEIVEHENGQLEIPFLFLYLSSIETEELKSIISYFDLNNPEKVISESIPNLIGEIEKILKPNVSKLEFWSDFYGLDPLLVDRFFVKRQDELISLFDIINDCDKLCNEWNLNLNKQQFEKINRIVGMFRNDIEQYQSIDLTDISQSKLKLLRSVHNRPFPLILYLYHRYISCNNVLKVINLIEKIDPMSVIDGTLPSSIEKMKTIYSSAFDNSADWRSSFSLYSNYIDIYLIEKADKLQQLTNIVSTLEILDTGRCEEENKEVYLQQYEKLILISKELIKNIKGFNRGKNSRSVLELLNDGKEKNEESFLYLYLHAISTDNILIKLKLLEKPTSSSVLDGTLQKTIKELRTIFSIQLSNFEAWVKIYKRRHINLVKKLKSLKRSYTKLLEQFIDLLEIQQSKCSFIERLLRNDLDIKLFTANYELLLQDYRSRLDEIIPIDFLFKKIITASPIQNDLNDIDKVSSKYLRIIQKLFQWFDNVYENVGIDYNPFLFPPIEIELRQGSVYRNFENLSFGQRCGIVLKVLFETTNKKIIIVDQPEDNLDADSVVSIVAPTLKRLKENRQIIIATHNSNLVMRLPTCTLEIMESKGDYGYLKIYGRLQFREVLTEMLTILEGGTAHFLTKLDAYQEFIEKVIPFTIHRQRTITEMKSYISQIQNDPAWVSSILHEFNSGRLNEVQVLIERLEHSDRKPEFTDIELYSFLLSISTPYLTSQRKIFIDNRLEDLSISFDRTHLKFIFVNLFENSFRATQRRKAEQLLDDESSYNEDRLEKIEINLEDSCRDGYLNLIIHDNGCGMCSSIREKIYKEKCTDQDGLHGIGALLIKKWLERNKGTIVVLDSDCNCGTKQRISLPKALN